MNERDDRVYLRDIVDSIEMIERYMDNISLSEFDQNFLIQDAVIRRFEVIGEAASKISDALKASVPEIEWRLMTDMRNKLIHEYFGVSTSTMYNTICSDLPDLKKKIQALLLIKN